MPKKYYNGVQYDTDLDYTTEINNAAEAGDYARAAVRERQRNAKIAGEGMGYAQTSDWVKYLPTDYDVNADYMKLMEEAAGRGDYAAAWDYEQKRNKKLAGEYMSDVSPTSKYAKYAPNGTAAGEKYKFDPTQDPDYRKHTEQMYALYDKIMNREPFSYDAESDPLYRQYRDQYTAQGKTAMRDTMGQASALTGGYGSTYAEQAGEQAFQAYLSRLNEVLPELYGAAYDRYNGETNKLMNLYSMAKGGADTAYDRGFNEWSTKLGLEREDEDTAYNRQQAEAANAEAKMQNFRSYLASLIGMGYMPTADDLRQAGMTQAQADALHQQYLLDQQSFNAGTGGGRSSGRRSSGRSSGGSGSAVQPASGGGGNYLPTGAGKSTQTDSAAYRLTGGAKDTSHLNEYQTLASAEKYWSQLEQLSNGGSSVASMLAQVKKWESSGVIDQRTAAEMIESYRLYKSSNSSKSGSQDKMVNGRQRT